VVDAIRLVIELVNVPIPVPSVVLVDKAMVGFAVVLQQTPRAVTAAPPSVLIVPPLLAVVLVIADIAVVVITGMVAVDAVVKTESPP
jgi:hypothetical protein